MRAIAAILALGVVSATLPAQARCIVQGRFDLSSEGPWRFHATVDAGTPCGPRTFWSGNGMVFKRLNVFELPRHGKLDLIEGGKFRYVPAAGYRGEDAFLLEVCGIEPAGRQGCAKIAFGVVVR